MGDKPCGFETLNDKDIEKLFTKKDLEVSEIKSFIFKLSQFSEEIIWSGHLTRQIPINANKKCEL